MSTLSFDPWGKDEDADELPAQVHRGQARIAYRLADSYAGRLLHVYGLGWHYWDGRRWAPDDQGEATRAVLDVLRTALGESFDDRELQADVRKCESSSAVSGVLDLASALEPFACTVATLDADPYVLNVSNGTLDLRTNELRAHNPRDRITKVTGAAYEPDAHGPTWDKFLERVLPEEPVRQFVQRYVGLGLAGKVIEHVLAILTGTGRNGKSVFYGAVNAALGDYASTAEPDLFMHRDGAHPTGEMDLRGVRWVVVSESDKGRRIAEATVKRLTGGDKIRARRMRQDFVEFEPSHTAALVTNHLPRVSGDDPAIWARLRVVPFDVVIPTAEQDPHLGDQLRLESEAILTWAIRGWSEYRRIGLAEPEAVVQATAAYHADSDAVARFINECCLTNPHMWVTVGDLFDRWTRWAVDDGAEPVSKRAFGEALDTHGFPASKGTGGQRIRKGLGLASDEEDDR